MAADKKRTVRSGGRSAKKNISGSRETDRKIWRFIYDLNSVSSERLDKTALICCDRKYTYRQMFRHWEYYAEVFSSLGITGKNGSRAAVVSEITASSVLAFYGLNMTGASVSMMHLLDFFDESRWQSIMDVEGITDLLICDTKLGPAQLARLMRDKKKLGLRNIIILHVPMEGRFVDEEKREKSRRNYRALKKMKGVLFMDELLEKYAGMTVVYGTEESEEAALIIHTSGSTKGIHQPVPFSDSAFNEAAARLLRDKRFSQFEGTAVSAVGTDFSWAYSIVDELHLPLAYGGAVILLPFGYYNPGTYEAMSEYDANLMFAGPKQLSSFKMMGVKPDFSSLKYMFVGGAAVSPDNRKKFNKLIKEAGGSIEMTAGYGLTELGGACMIASPDSEDGAAGHLLDGVGARIYSEYDGLYHDPEDGACEGVLYLTSGSLSSGRIGKNVLFELEEIEGKKYYNTNDYVKVYEDGGIRCIGRANKFFVNNDGVKFDAGFIEAAVSEEPGVDACVLVPEMNKIIHDTVPVLYVQTDRRSGSPKKVIEKALVNVFVRNDGISDTQLPLAVVAADNIPLTVAGKPDAYAIVRDGAEGKRYAPAPVMRGEKLTDIKLTRECEGLQTEASAVPEELRDHFDMTRQMKVMGFDGDQCILPGY